MMHHKQSGLTITELAVSLGVVGVLFGIIVQVIHGLSGMSSTSLSVGRIEEAANEVTDAIAEELRWADPGSLLITDANGSSRVELRTAQGYDGTQTVWSSPIVFRIEPMGWDANEDGVLDEGQLLRVQDGVERTLCRNVSLGGFTVAVANSTVVVGVEVFTSDKDKRVLSATAESAVHLMNRSSW